MEFCYEETDNYLEYATKDDIDIYGYLAFTDDAVSHYINRICNGCPRDDKLYKVTYEGRYVTINVTVSEELKRIRLVVQNGNIFSYEVNDK